ncbi:3-deoxy-D-manno-octulosonate 8-phosphate phosphatase (KDO 8-P phosphatase) [Pseudobutyrivibrio sp. NOR37]|uniref:3-deoxy-D-manno-octulosonate 8-phosphate phosphatase n=1 Tax=Pseudobutyrivibrio xylanivorans TaxID=185007 RepID=A0A6M0LLA3_PSEXY|nr:MULTISPECIES: 3-deoxy-D-manno-octulosonate 8-phosphate phosphatase [Pseudobutyrivibrio]NEX01661.1 3-deoxy-D-manno-octulosonate 8-phosphate phosphatase [Pseudobutyrivibrio xylanivorans]SFR70816.1 3-deoxy-D-manno-octulosonate 8-phosphate phosphatase (KDO 8-P phosphatase) [Pseudobutyrivibrio sp. NOR37]
MKDIKYLVLDVDGTLTDGCVYMGENGELCKAFNIKDGYGICHQAIPAGIVPVIITGRTSNIVLNRCKELGINEIHQGISDKLGELNEILAERGESLKDCAYMGDDLNDLHVMKAIKAAGGLIGCPADAAAGVVELADFVSSKDGGRGCVREFIEWILY